MSALSKPLLGKWKNKPETGRKHLYYLINTSDKELLFTIYKEYSKFNNMKTNGPIKNGQNIWTAAS